MQYMILDSAGNALASFDEEGAARSTLHAMVRVEPDGADHLALLAYDDDGMPVGDALSAVDVGPAVSIEPSRFLQPSLTCALLRQVSRHQTRYYPGGRVVSAPNTPRLPTSS